MDKPGGREPVLNLPPAVSWLIGLNVLVQIIRQFIPERSDDWLISYFAVIADRYQAQSWGWPAWVSPLSHQFLHAGWLHLGVNMLMLSAFGSGMERHLGARRMLALYGLSGIAAAAAQVALDPASDEPMVGASGAICGLLGGVLWLLQGQGNKPGRFARVALMAMVTIGAMIGTGLIGLPDQPDLQIAWGAHIGGLLCGLVLFPLLDCL